MASITYHPWGEIVLHEVKELSIADLLESIVSQAEAQKVAGIPALLWADGIAFSHGEFMETPQLVDDKLKGKLHFAIVNFAKTSFQEMKKVTWNGREHTVRLVKAEDNPNFVNLAKFLNEFKPGMGPTTKSDESEQLKIQG